jgi:hypothetical protein
LFALRVLPVFKLRLLITPLISLLQELKITHFQK